MKHMIKNIFPTVPPFKAEWMAIYLEPIVDSGERITIAVAIVSREEKLFVYKTINDKLLIGMYGDFNLNIKNMIEVVIESLEEEYYYKGSLDLCQAPFEGIFHSKIHKSAAANINGILEQAIRSTSSFSNLQDVYNSEENRTQRWISSVNSHVISLNSELKHSFNQIIEINIKGTTGFKKFGFAANGYVSNLVHFNAKYPSKTINTIQSKLMDLELLKQSYNMFAFNKFDILIGESDSGAIPDRNLTDIKLLKEAINAENINFIICKSNVIAAERIVQMAVA